MRRFVLAMTVLGASVLASALQASSASAAVTPPQAVRSCSEAAPVLSVRSVPALPGVHFELSGRAFYSGPDGVAQIAVAECGTYSLKVFPPRRPAPGVRAKFARWGDEFFTPVRPLEIGRSRLIEVGFEVEYLVREDFVDLQGKPVPTRRVSRIVQTNSLGSKVSFPPGKARWLIGSRIMRRYSGLQETEILWSIRKVMLSGSSVVREAQQRFFPKRNRHWRIRLLLYSATITARDRLFGFPIGSGIVLTYPDGHEERHRLGSNAELRLQLLPRGTYYVTVKAPGLKSIVPIALTRDQVVPLKVVSYFDVAIVFGLLAISAVALVLVPRPHIRSRLRSLVLLRWARGRRGANAMFVIALGVLIFVIFFGAASPAKAASPATVRSPVPTLAYYYIWFDRGSWNRAKTDYPLLGRYSSDDSEVMRQHIKWAKSAGIDGFIVSWKSTTVLNRRLGKLVRAAEELDFKLSIIYQGLDFEREPLPATRIEHDLRHFANRYAHTKPFDLFRKPLVIWSGTWRFPRSDIARVTGAVRSRLLVLASEKTTENYQLIADLVDGDAYYWSSVNPSTFRGYAEKLQEMSAAIHTNGGLWIAPAAPGFDARLVGGQSVVDRKGGATLRREYDTAIGSSPDAVGVISWNEFSENSHIEPSRAHGARYLQELADILGSKLVIGGDFDSSQAATRHIGYTLPLFIGFGFVIAMGTAAVFWRRQLRKVGQGHQSTGEAGGI